MQDLDDVGFALGSTRMSFKILDATSANGLVEIMNPELKRRVLLTEESHEKMTDRIHGLRSL